MRTSGNGATILILFLTPAVAWPQTAGPDKPGGAARGQQTQQSGSAGASASQKTTGKSPLPQKPEPNPAQATTPASQKTTDDSEGKQTKRMFWIVPNFAAVSADTRLPPLSVRAKFVLATQDSVDYSSFVWAATLAGQSMALNSYPELGYGFKGYARYYWRAFADQASGAYFTEAIVPAITHEDPRYYTLGHGGFFRRTAYALSHVVITPTDSGGTSFNYSEILGNGLEAGLSSAYYPPQERTLRNTAANWGAQIESAALNNVIREFWPDIRHKILRQK